MCIRLLTEYACEHRGIMVTKRCNSPGTCNSPIASVQSSYKPCPPCVQQYGIFGPPKAGLGGGGGGGGGGAPYYQQNYAYGGYGYGGGYWS